MADFKVIETQEQLDAIIGERLKRERESMAKKYESYLSPEDLTSRTEELTTQITELGNSLTAAKEKADADARAIADLESRVQTYETASVKSRIAHEIGLPFELANRITGNTEDEIRADATALLSVVGKKTLAPPLASTEGHGVDKKEQDMRSMLKDLNL